MNTESVRNTSKGDSLGNAGETGEIPATDIPTDSQPKGLEGEALAARLSEVEGISDDAAELIANNWQRVVTGMLACLLVVWLIGQFRTSLANKNEEASLRFSSIQTRFSSGLDKVLEDESAKTAIIDSVSSLQNSHSGSVYAGLADLYLARLRLAEGQFEEARGILSSAGANLTGTTSGAIDKDSLRSELAALLYGKSYFLEADSLVTEEAIADESKRLGLIAKGRDSLSSSLESASLVGVEIIHTLLLTAETEEEVQVVRDQALAFQDRHPSQAIRVEQVFTQLGEKL